METECYPCIPMHSASNQKRMNHSTITMVKQEPLSEDINVVVDDEDNRNNSRSILNSVMRQKAMASKRRNGGPFRMQQHTVRLSRVSLGFFFDVKP